MIFGDPVIHPYPSAPICIRVWDWNLNPHNLATVGFWGATHGENRGCFLQKEAGVTAICYSKSMQLHLLLISFSISTYIFICLSISLALSRSLVLTKDFTPKIQGVSPATKLWLHPGSPQSLAQPPAAWLRVPHLRRQSWTGSVFKQCCHWNCCWIMILWQLW